MDKFLIDLDDCVFKEEVDYVDEDQSFNASTGLAYYFDDYKGPRTAKYIRIFLNKKINENEYCFISPLLSMDIDNLKIKIAFFKQSYVYYDNNDPNEYYFEL